MSKQGIIGRVTQLARADISGVLDCAEDPELTVDQLLRDYTRNISRAERAIARLVGNLQMVEDDQTQDATAAEQWNREAEATSQKADELRAAGDAAPADTFDNLARAALERQLIAENDVQTGQHTLDAQRESAEKLISGLSQMRVRLSELQRKRHQLVAGSGRAYGPPQLTEAAMSTDVLDSAAELTRFEEKVRREEARVRSCDALAKSALDAQFTSLGDQNRAEIDELLTELKAGRAMASARARARQQISR